MPGPRIEVSDVCGHCDADLSPSKVEALKLTKLEAGYVGPPPRGFNDPDRDGRSCGVCPFFRRDDGSGTCAYVRGEMRAAGCCNIQVFRPQDLTPSYIAWAPKDIRERLLCLQKFYLSKASP